MKVSNYNHVTTSFSDGRYIAFNAFTGAYFEMDESRLCELNALIDSVENDGKLPDSPSAFQKRAAEQGFVVATDRDELAEVRARYWERLGDDKGLSLTIAPTVSCNFGCGYCFQSHSNRRMGKNEMDRLVAFADEKLDPGTQMSVTWFGGEPLTAFPVVEALATRLSELAKRKDCAFHHWMISNGLLLTEERAKFLASVPQFESVQITLDGTAEHHDERRPTLSGAGTFESIVRNVAAAAKHIRVTIRVNVDKRNVGSLQDLLDGLAAERLQERVYVYLGHVWHYTPEVEDSPFLTIEEFAAVESQFKLMKFAAGFNMGVSLPRLRAGAQCVADRPNGYVVGPSGLLFNCWNEVHENEDKASGVLPEKEGGSSCGHCGTATMRENARHWSDYNPFSHTPCQTCKVAPLCMSGCPWESAKNAPEETGFCTSLRFNLADELRLYEMRTHLESKAQSVAEEACGSVPIEPR